MKKLYHRTAARSARTIVRLFALALLFFPSAAVAQAIDLKLTNVTVKQAIEALNQRENYSVAVKSAGVDMQRRVNVTAQGATIAEVLDQIFAGQDITYTITGNSIAVTKAAPHKAAPATTANVLQGTVRDAAGQPVVGATILVDNTTIGTTSGGDGQFELQNIQLPATLNVSFIGYQTQLVNVRTYASQEIVLLEGTAAIDEVVVVG